MKYKLYRGVRTPRRCRVTFEISEPQPDGSLDRMIGELRPRNDLRDHSPTGFGWGYLGSGPAQLALALAADATGDDVRALRVHQTLEAKLVANLPMNAWEITEESVIEHIKMIEGA